MSYSDLNISKEQLEDEILHLKQEIFNLKKEQERLKSQENISEKERLFELMFKEAGIGIGIIDKDLRICKYNKSFYDLFGYKPVDLKDKTYLDLIPKNSCENAIKIIRDMFDSKLDKYITEAVYLTKDQKKIWLKLVATVIKDQNGNPEFILGMGEDITERIESRNKLEDAKAKIEESDKLKSAFLTNMSHEIRTPLNAIIGFSELIAEPTIDQQSRKEFAEQVSESSNMLLKLIDDIIDMSQLDSGNLKINNRKFNISKVLNNLYEQFIKEQARSKKNIELLLHNPFGDSIAYIETDEFRFNQIFNHLLNNALKYTHKGFIEFGFDINQHDEPIFYVRDTGIGIPNEKLNTVFNHFTKIEDRTTLYRGTGIGLTITKKLVNLLGGKIWVESNLGAGSIFYFSLPNKVKFLNIGNKNGQKINNWVGKKVLIAEDEVSNYEVIKASLARTHVCLDWVKNGEDAVQKCLEIDYDLVLMDIKMPVLDGIDATRKIKAFKPDLPIIAQSAFVLKNERDLCIDAGCDEYIPKPIKSHVLLEMIEKFFANGK